MIIREQQLSVTLDLIELQRVLPILVEKWAENENFIKNTLLKSLYDEYTFPLVTNRPPCSCQEEVSKSMRSLEIFSQKNGWIDVDNCDPSQIPSFSMLRVVCDQCHGSLFECKGSKVWPEIEGLEINHCTWLLEMSSDTLKWTKWVFEQLNKLPDNRWRSEFDNTLLCVMGVHCGIMGTEKGNKKWKEIISSYVAESAEEWLLSSIDMPKAIEAYLRKGEIATIDIEGEKHFYYSPNRGEIWEKIKQGIPALQGVPPRQRPEALSASPRKGSPRLFSHGGFSDDRDS